MSTVDAKGKGKVERNNEETKHGGMDDGYASIGAIVTDEGEFLHEEYQREGYSEALSLESREPTQVPPHTYIYLLELKTGVERVVLGPDFVQPGEEFVITRQPSPMISVPVGHYCVVANPVVYKDGKAQMDDRGVAEQLWGRQEVRTYPWPPFAVFPGEQLVKSVSAMPQLYGDEALLLLAKEDVEEETGETDEDGKMVTRLRRAGEEWMVYGPVMYTPRVEVEILEQRRAVSLTQHQGLLLEARSSGVDASGQQRYQGDRWLVRGETTYLPNENEAVVRVVEALDVTWERGLWLRATESFTDAFGVSRRIGDEWGLTLGTLEELDPMGVDVKQVSAELLSVRRRYLPSASEVVVDDAMPVAILSSRHHCIKLDRFQQATLVRGPCEVYVAPGEKLDARVEGSAVRYDDAYLIPGVRHNYVCTAEDTLLLCALESHTDDMGVFRRAGEQWLHGGPCNYVPSEQVRVLERRSGLWISQGRGVYVRNLDTMQVRLERGPQVLQLGAQDEYWQKDTSAQLTQCLQATPGWKPGCHGQEEEGEEEEAAWLAIPVDAIALTFALPAGCVCHVVDFATKEERVTRGPCVMMLGPHEQPTLMNLGAVLGMQPPVLCAIPDGADRASMQTVAPWVPVGPGVMIDQFRARTSEGVVWDLKLVYHWQVQDSLTRTFKDSDFVDHVCAYLHSRLRVHMESLTLEQVFADSAATVLQGVFLGDAQQLPLIDRASGSIQDITALQLPSNGVCVTSVEILAIVPHVEPSVLARLQQTAAAEEELELSSAQVQEQTTQAAQAAAQESREEVDEITRQLNEEKAALQARLEQALAESKEEEERLRAKAEHRAESALMEGRAALQRAQMLAEAKRLETQAIVEQMEAINALEKEQKRALVEMEVERAERLGALEVEHLKAVAAAQVLALEAEQREHAQIDDVVVVVGESSSTGSGEGSSKGKRQRSEADEALAKEGKEMLAGEINKDLTMRLFLLARKMDGVIGAMTSHMTGVGTRLEVRVQSLHKELETLQGQVENAFGMRYDPGQGRFASISEIVRRVEGAGPAGTG